MLGYVDIQPQTDERRLRFRRAGRVTWGIETIPSTVSSLEEVGDDLLFYNPLHPEGLILFTTESQAKFNTTLSVLRLVEFGSTLSIHDTAYFGNMLSVNGYFQSGLPPGDTVSMSDFTGLEVSDRVNARVYLGWRKTAVSVTGQTGISWPQGYALSVTGPAYFQRSMSIHGRASPDPWAQSAQFGSVAQFCNFVRLGDTLSVNGYVRIGNYCSVKGMAKLND
jgi:hypothetical protein